MGVPATAPGLEPVAGISLGSATISPVDMANSYGTIADGGRAKKWYVIYKVTSAEGSVRYKAPTKNKRVLPEDVDRGRQLRAPAGGQGRHRQERAGAGPSRRRQDRHRHQRRRQRLVVLVRRLHPAAAHRDDVRPR